MNNDDLAERLRLPSFSKRDHLAAADRIEQLVATCDELEAKLAKALTELKMLIDVSTLMQSSAAYDKRRHQNIITDTVWGQWAKQLKFARTTLAELKGNNT
jgi:hypothetical protein